MTQRFRGDVMHSHLIDKMLSARRIAVVGVSDNPARPSHFIARYLMDAGYEIFPVNPGLTKVLGVQCFANLKDVPGPIDLVNVFRAPAFIEGIVREVIGIGAGGVWVQSGIQSVLALRTASDAGLDYIQDRCIMLEHVRWLSSK